MSIRKNTLSGRVVIKWDSMGKPEWNLEQTLGICIEVNNEFETRGFNPTPKFREAIKSNDRPYLKNWVQGCHFPWLKPMRNYWVTTHWPPEVGEQPYLGIFLYEGTQKVGTDIRPGDRVWIYQSRSGRRILREKPDGSTYKKKRQQGKESVVALMEVVSELHDIGGQPEKYEDGSELWWRWKADTKLINQSGFISRIELNRIMDYKSKYNYHAFGDSHSGLKRISEDVHKKILQVFNQNQPSATKPIKRDPRSYGRRGHGKGGEGKIHKALKERIAANPSQVLGEDGLSLIQVEYPYPTGDRADLILKNLENQYIAVEVEVAVDLHDLSGVLQAIKYSRMYAIECRRKFEEVKAYLVAHQISDGVKDLCHQYDIETFVIDKV